MTVNRMPSEPFEAVFARPPALTTQDENQLRELELEGVTITATTPGDDNEKSGIPPLSQQPHTLSELEAAFTRKGVHIVKFEPGTGEDPREFSKAKKWLVI